MSRTRPVYPRRPMVRKPYRIQSKRPTRVQTRTRQIARQMVNQRTGGYVGMELKFWDLSTSNAAPSNAGNMSGGTIDPAVQDCLNSPTVGNNQNQRIGRKITMKNLTVKGVIQWNWNKASGDPTTLPPVMIAIILDKQNNSAAALTSQEVFTNPGTLAALVCNPLRNLEYTSRYQVLWKKVYAGQVTSTEVVNVPGTYASAGVITPFSAYINLKNLQVLFNAENGNSTDITDNAIHIVAFSDHGTNSGEIDVDISYHSRLRFVG